jgi:hypothetical protein
VNRVWWHLDGDITVYCDKVEHPDLAEALVHEGWTRKRGPRPKA